MRDLLEVVSGIISSSTKRVEVVAQNIANVSTAGYKRQIPFVSFIKEAQSANQKSASLVNSQFVNDLPPAIQIATDHSTGAFAQTGNPYDFAISGDGFFAIRTPTGIGYTRQGTFKRADDGTLTTPQGWILQAQGGGDVTLRGTAVRIEADGSIVEDQHPTSRIGIVDFANRAALVRGEGGVFTAAAEPFDVDRATLKVGTTEASNVNTGEDMVKMMEALRTAELGQRFALAYDDLMGRAVTTFIQAPT